ncbi:HTH-type transcriptional activator CmpR [Ensifer adhaerens]|uniref:DNA-binding transcriptional LysR family regulator n=1 Tax=Ensifer adhaerens TaxID=106592 RepID=A0ACC5T5B3_ENSAD|nr:LysR family transcriptional regulator [Ensifer adhaerens]MBP1876313.1 DNA-binding transcriptional LysR family regulator [Ensifer adhaerens]NRP21959.1 HTH-type transcriptional activator CmpR [Ensifer adhaerens]
MKNITFRQLKSILAIEKHAKIVGAAKVLGLTAPAVTLQLKQIEAEAGVSLFDRMAHGMFPTEAGHAVLSAARDIEQRLAQLEEELDAFKGVKRGRIAVGAVSTVKYFAQPMLAAFAALYPNIDLELFIERRAETVERLRNRTIDVALLGRPPREFSVRAAIFGEHSLIAVCARHHPLVGRHSISKSEIAREHFYLRSPDSGTRVFFDRFMSDIPGRAEGPNTEMESIEDIKRAILSDNGIAFLAAHSVAAEVQAGKLAILDVVGLPIRRQWFAVSRTDRAMTPLISAFENFLVTEGKKFLPDFIGPDDASA